MARRIDASTRHDLMDDRGMRLLNRWFPALVALSLLVPFGVGLALTGAVVGGEQRLLWGGFVRIFFVHHITWSINSICHFHGARRFATRRPLDERLVAFARLARRGLAPQPPRLPALGLPRPALVGSIRRAS